MIQVSTDYVNIIANGGHYEWKIVNYNKTIGSDLKRGSLTLTLFEQASIGNVLASQLDFEYYDDGVALNTSYPLVVSFRAVSDSSTSEWLQKGSFRIDTIEQSPYSNVVKVTAFDDLLKANVPWMKSGTFAPTTDLAIVRSIASDIGVLINPSTLSEFNNPIQITDAPSIGENGTTSIEMLSYIGVMHGGNWIIDSNGDLKLIKLFSEQGFLPYIANVGDAVEDFDASPVEYVVGVCIWNSENHYFRVPNVTDEQWERLSGRIIDAKCYIGASQELAQSLYDTLSLKAYYPYTTNKAWVDLKYELGDGVIIKDVSSVICNQVINLTALGSCSLEAKGRDIVTSHYPVPTPVERQIARNEAKTQASITVLSDSIESTVETVDGIQTQVTQNSEGLEAVTQRVDNSESYLRWNGSTATLSIGESSSPTEAQVSPNGFSVIQNGEEILSSEGRKVSAKHFEATDDVIIGDYQWADEEINGFSLMYIGE